MFKVTVVCLTLRSERGDAGDGRRRGNADFELIMFKVVFYYRFVNDEAPHRPEPTIN